MRNKKFRLCEQAIFTAYYKVRDLPNTKKLARRAKISRQAFYAHHKSPQWIPYDYEKYLLDSYKTKMRKLLTRQQVELKMIMLRMLIFIYSHREMIDALLRDGRVVVIKEMVAQLKPRVISEWNLAGNLDEIFQIYTGEILGVIVKWAQDGFLDEKLDMVLGKIMLLTKTTPRRLASLIEQRVL